MGVFRRARSNPDKWVDDARAWVGTLNGVQRLSDVEPRSVARVAGVVRVLRVRPREGVPAIEAVVSDGTGTVTAVWLGRRAMPGLSLGARLILSGRAAGEQQNLQMLNPEYEFAAPKR
jgi:RecG-like helicase